MTIEQSIYKMFKFLSKDKNNNVIEEIPNKFSFTYYIDINVPEYSGTYGGNKKIYLDFNTKIASWYTRSYNYVKSIYVENSGKLDWDTLMPLVHSVLLRNMKNNIEYRLLRAEEERTQKVRQLRVACEMRRELNAIEDFV